MTTPSDLSDVPARTRARRGPRVIVTAALVPLVVTVLAGPFSRPGAAADRPMPAEAELVDHVPTPDLRWTTCRQTAECATVALPLDYRRPHGATIDVGLLRIKAKDPRHRIGTLFANPGGPGGSAADFVFQNAPGLPEAIRDRFDVVGIDPRGVGLSRQIRCFATTEEQSRVEGRLAFAETPGTPAEQRDWINAAQDFGRACSTTAQPIASAMSSTDDARDMDVLRRAVGDGKLTFLAQSGGSYLGQVYANMFPDRVRAIALDGIVDPQAFAGTPATADVPVFDRIGAAAASSRALRELLKRCQQAGRSQCSFADADTAARFDRLATRLRTEPLRLAAPGAATTTYTYANLIDDTEHWLHDPDGYLGLFADLTDLARLTAPGGGGAGHDALVRDFLGRHPAAPPAPGYDNFFEAFSAIACTDGLHAADAASWPASAAAAERGAEYFGAYYAWFSAQCARNSWTARDEDVYRGPFDHRTAAPVLVVGNRWDPATSYDNAVKVAALLPNSRLVSSDSWGHQALATSGCVDDAVFGYLIDPPAPAPKITYCRGDVQPFAPAPDHLPFGRK